MPLVSMMLAGLKFSRKDMGEVGKNEEDTIPAVLMILISVLFGTTVAFFKGNGGSSGFANLELTGFNAAIAEFGGLLVGTFVFAIILALVMRIFKAKPGIVGTFRVWGAAIIWSIIGDIVGLLLGWLLPDFAMLSIVFWLLFNIALMIGMVGYTDAKYWQSFLSIVIAFAIIFGVTMLYGMLVGMIFV